MTPRLYKDQTIQLNLNVLSSERNSLHIAKLDLEQDLARAEDLVKKEENVAKKKKEDLIKEKLAELRNSCDRLSALTKVIRYLRGVIKYLSLKLN